MHGMHAMRPEHMPVSVIFTVYTRKMPFLLLPPVARPTAGDLPQRRAAGAE